MSRKNEYFAVFGLSLVAAVALTGFNQVTDFDFAVKLFIGMLSLPAWALTLISLVKMASYHEDEVKAIDSLIIKEGEMEKELAAQKSGETPSQSQ